MSNASDARESVLEFMLGDHLGKEEFAGYLRLLDDAIAAGQPFSMIVDGSSPAFEISSLPNRRWQLSRAAGLGKLHRGIAFITGTMTRERVRALYALQPPGVAYAFFTDRAEAQVWAREVLDSQRKSEISQRKTQPIIRAVSS